MLALVNVTTAGDNTLVSAVSDGRGIRVLGYHLVADGEASITFQRDTTPLTGPMSMAPGVPHSWPVTNSLDAPVLFRCPPGEALTLDMFGATTVSGWVIYDLAN